MVKITVLHPGRAASTSGKLDRPARASPGRVLAAEPTAGSVPSWAAQPTDASARTGSAVALQLRDPTVHG
jgi:hypothetical protein